MNVVAGTEVKPDRFAEITPKGESTPGVEYEIDCIVNSIDEDKLCCSTRLADVADELYDRFGAKLKYFEVNDNKCRLQVEGSPFVWTALLASLPSILTIVGVIVTIVSVFTLIQNAPWEMFALLVGLGLVYGSGTITNLIWGRQ